MTNNSFNFWSHRKRTPDIILSNLDSHCQPIHSKFDCETEKLSEMEVDDMMNSDELKLDNENDLHSIANDPYDESIEPQNMSYIEGILFKLIQLIMRFVGSVYVFLDFEKIICIVK